MFYDRLNLLCKQHDTSITEVSVTHLGVSNATATSWKKGAAPRSDTVVRAAAHFGVTTDYLLGLSAEPYAAPAPAPQDVQELIVQLLHANPTARAAAIAAAQAVLQALEDAEA